MQQKQQIINKSKRNDANTEPLELPLPLVQSSRNCALSSARSSGERKNVKNTANGVSLDVHCHKYANRDEKYNAKERLTLYELVHARNGNRIVISHIIALQNGVFCAIYAN